MQDGRRVTFRRGEPSDTLPIAAALLAAFAQRKSDLPLGLPLGCNPLSTLLVQPSRHIVCESASDGARIGFAQLRVLAATREVDATTYNARPGTANMASDADDEAWDDLERDLEELGGLKTGLLLPWSDEYRKLDERAALQRARRGARVAQAAVDAQPLWELRSVVVADEWRGVGVGSALVRRLMSAHEGRGRQASDVYLLANERTAGWYEARFGFGRVADEAVPRQMVAAKRLSAVLGAQLVCMRGGGR